jgi:two-component system cell cycle sensor histidine kinase/response regulator CckA
MVLILLCILSATLGVWVWRLVLIRRRLLQALDRRESSKTTFEDQLKQAQKMESMGLFAGGIAHDFNNLIQIIQGYTESLMEVEPIGASGIRKADQILKATGRASKLIRQLLIFSRNQTVEPTSINLNSVVEEMMPMLKRLLGSRIEVFSELSPKLGLVRMDRNQLEQIIMNLAVNARDAIPGKGTLGFITENTLGTGQNPEFFAKLTVSDSGQGMDSATKAKIFDPFFTTKQNDGGTGLGLSTVFGVVKQAGGMIEVTSVPGEGTSFEISLPIAKDQREVGEPVEKKKSRYPMPDEFIVLKKQVIQKIVLLVQVETELREVMAQLLRERGYTVLEAASAVHALSLCSVKGVRPDILITDDILPGEGSQALIEELKKILPHLQVLLVSGAMDEMEANAPGIDFIVKPFGRLELFEKLERS